MSTIGANKLKQVSGGSAEFEAGDVMIYSDTAESVSPLSSTLTKLKEALTGNGGTLRIKFDMAAGGSGHSAGGRIYRNGEAVGTLRGTSSTSFVTYSEDISGWSAGDLIQIYGSGTYQYGGKIKNFNICVDKAETILGVEV